ncbi:MAG: glutamate ABC transporter substrate-binding protein [Nocardioidaceae bacterium]|nr:glutamate ABC transporter substrate-binding protein [Nocardioidaceae bacterium]
MRFLRTQALATGAVLALVLSACGDDTAKEDAGPSVEVKDDTQFPEGSTMAKLADAGKVTIGVKVDQPGLGFLEPGAEAPEGFDIEMARIVAGALGIEDDGSIEWKETISDNREPFLEGGKVDLVFASYSITDERRQVVGQAGPYYVTGQQLLVREEDKEKITGPDDLKGVKVCSVEGSTSLATVQDEYGASPSPRGTYSECVEELKQKTVDVVTTDGSILLGYAAEAPDELEVVGKPFSEERYGVGYELGDTELCQFISDTLKASMEDGTWAEAFEATLGKSGVETPEPPALDECL